jgi:hypothetical protein
MSRQNICVQVLRSAAETSEQLLSDEIGYVPGSQFLSRPIVVKYIPHAVWLKAGAMIEKILFF